LLIGSISPDIATTGKEAMEHFVAKLLKRKENPVSLPALATGETDDSMWSAKQLEGVGDVAAVKRLWRGNFTRTGRYTGAPVMFRRPGRQILVEELDLKFTPRAAKAYPLFEQVKAEQNLDENTRMQVGINTLDILILGLRTAARTEVDVFIERTRREAQQIWELTSGNVFFLVEMPTATIMTNLLRNNKVLQNWLVRAYVKLIKALPAQSRWGIHFCHGRVGNSALFDNGVITETLQLRKLVYNPQRTVNFSNQLIQSLAESQLTPELVHYTMNLGKRPPTMDTAHYQAYRHIELPQETTVFAGAIHYRRETEDLVSLYRNFDKIFQRQVGVATYCGFGSMSGEQTDRCLDLMSSVANLN
jgi:hypothetical protein